ncbi:MAG: AMP-binding protein, partial [Acidobacteriota bacterium]
LDAASAARRGVSSLEHLTTGAAEVSLDDLATRRSTLRIDDVATVMYTSGTTGSPKGITFSHRNIVFKRFARALALPEIGEDDRFLCYLPLFHTFGRFLELTGCVFWGATYCFAENPGVETLARQMRELEATVLISIPMKWMQLYESVRQNVDTETADDAEIEPAVRRLVGPGLRWGLSAAGYLDPEIFRFFQRYGVELMSGFGMTEATGGITMTPPGRYREASLGPALPGIEISLAEDGELLIRGPYVMRGYLDPPEGVESFDPEGWLHTGDLMEMDDDGFIRIVDRKKEIYKNLNGQTISASSTCRHSSPRSSRRTFVPWWSAPTPSSHRSSASWTSRSSRGPSTPNAAS